MLIKLFLIIIILCVCNFVYFALKKRGYTNTRGTQKKCKIDGVALLVGHNKIKQGAYSNFLQESEFNYWLDVAKRVDGVRVFVREYTQNSYTKEMTKAIDELNKEHFKLVLELHFNASDNDKVKGCEVLVKKDDEKAQELAQEFIDKAHTTFNYPKRRVVFIDKNSPRGTYGILNSNATYLLTELFYGSNEDSLKFKDKDKVARFLSEFIKEVIDEV